MPHTVGISRNRLYTTIPDVRIDAGFGVLEIKDVQRLPHTPQIEALIKLAQQTEVDGESLKFNLIVSPRIQKIHGKILDAIFGRVHKPFARPQGSIKIFNAETMTMGAELSRSNFRSIPKRRGQGDRVYFSVNQE